MRRATAGAIARSFDRKRRHAVLSWTGNNRCKSVSETAGADAETAGFVECIEVVSCGFVAKSTDQLGAGAVFEVKCLFAIDSIAAAYRADWAQRRCAAGVVVTPKRSEQNARAYLRFHTLPLGTDRPKLQQGA